MKYSLKRYLASDFSPVNAGLVQKVPFKLPLEGRVVFDIYRIFIQANFTGTTAGIFALLMGMKYTDLMPGTTTLSSFDEELSRRDWIATHHVRYTAPGESLTEEHQFDAAVYPYTVWASPTFVYMYTSAGDHDMNNCHCQIHGIIRPATLQEWDKLQFEQRQEKRP